MKPAYFNWLVATIEVFTFVFVIACELICVGAIQSMVLMDFKPELAAEAVASAMLGVLVGFLGWLARRIVIGQRPEARGFAVLRPK